MDISESDIMTGIQIAKAIKGQSEPKQDAPAVEFGVTIVVLQRGWVVVGRLEKNGHQCLLTDASVIRVWGTKKGLGEIAKGGPTEKTVLDPTMSIRFHEMTSVAFFDCEDSKWKLS